MPEYRKLLIDGSEQTVQIENGTFTARDGRTLQPEDYPHLPPVTPRTIVCVHLSYRSRLEELGRMPPPAPTYFLKVTSSLNSHKGTVVRPSGCRFLNYEGEIALVVGRTCRNIAPEQASEYILGYTVANDMGLHDFRDTDENSMVRVKGSDTLAPIGPGINTDWEFGGKTLRTYVDGCLVQEASTDEFLWTPNYMLADICRTITLKPGDIIMTGTPANSRPVSPGSTVVVDVEGLGRLENHVVSGEWSVPTEYGAQPSDSDGVQSIALGSDFRRDAS